MIFMRKMVKDIMESSKWLVTTHTLGPLTVQ